MSVVITFKSAAMSSAQYDQVITALEAAHAGNPPGRLYHVCYGDPSRLNVTDVWDGRENFQLFAQTLMPVLQKIGVDPGTPEMYPVHNVIEHHEFA